MTERDFCYWLQGLLEVGRVETLDAGQVKMIADHLALVFKKVTPSYQATRDWAPQSIPNSGIPIWNGQQNPIAIC